MDKAIALARKALESTYTGLCAIVEYQEVVVNYETRTEEVTVIKNQPCKLSKKTISPANQSEVATTVAYAPLLFIAPEVEIKPGSIIIISQNGVTRKYERSGEPFIYETHQELTLQRVDKA